MHDALIPWRVCPTCPPSDCEWDDSAFTVDPSGERCNDCYSHTKKVRRPCSSPKCRRRVITTLAVEKPRCQPCRRRMAALERARAAWMDRHLDGKAARLLHELEELIAA